MVIKRSITSIVIKVEFSLNESIFYDQTLKFMIINFHYVINLTQKLYLFSTIVFLICVAGSKGVPVQQLVI